MPDDPNAPADAGDDEPWRAPIPPRQEPGSGVTWPPPNDQSSSAPYGQPGQGGAYGQPPYGRPPYGQPPYGQPPYGPPYGQPPYGQQYGPAPYGPAPDPQAAYGPSRYGQPYTWPYTPPPSRPPLSPEQRRRRTRRNLAFAGVLVLAIGAGIGIGAAIAPTSPVAGAKSLLNASIDAATSAGSYRYVELSTLLGSPDDISGDALANGGRQVITQKCSSGLSVFDLRLVKGAVYFRGNNPAVVDQLGVPTTRSSADVDRWVKVVKGEKPYGNFAEGITTTSNIAELRSTIVPTASKAIAGSSPPTTEITGGLFSQKNKPPIGTVALDITASNDLPRSLRGSASSTAGRYAISWTFSHFGEKLHIAPPKRTVAYSSLHAAPPPKGTCA